MNLYSEFTKYCRFWFKIFQNVMWKNSIFLTSEARLSPNLQNWTKLLRFYNSGLSGQLSFEWPDWKSLGLNYSNGQACWFNNLLSFFLKNAHLKWHIWHLVQRIHAKPFWSQFGPIWANFWTKIGPAGPRCKTEMGSKMAFWVSSNWFDVIWPLEWTSYPI